MINRPTAYPPNGIPFKDRLKPAHKTAEEPHSSQSSSTKTSWVKRLLKKIKVIR